MKKNGISRGGVAKIYTLIKGSELGAAVGLPLVILLPTG